MAPRPHWNGYLKLSFVTCPISLYPAVSPAERVSFRQVNRGTGNRIKHQLVDSVTGAVVDPLDKARGYEVGENQFVMVEDQELADAKQDAKALPFLAPRPNERTESAPPRAAGRPTSKPIVRAPPLAPAAPELPAPQAKPVSRTIEIVRFVPIAQIDSRYIEKPYYIVPRGQVALEAFTVIREAMAGQGLAGVGHVVLSNRERPIALQPMGVGMRGTTLRYPYEVRGEAEYFEDIPPVTPPKEMVDIARHIVTTMKADFDPAALNDREREAVIDMLKDKQKGLPAPARKAPSATNIVNLMDALKKSMAAGKPASGKKSKPARSRS
jgi:DNA end-binding protein Ku